MALLTIKQKRERGLDSKGRFVKGRVSKEIRKKISKANLGGKRK